ncbi:uncharacterized protein VTP21DRAFT_809 [Calcarisporiella thermophila]|uniref:uncharacterized protein n=1 Tax=Calcarisporiella thermophila TaxID=911321 RepID=UPI0037436966
MFNRHFLISIVIFVQLSFSSAAAPAAKVSFGHTVIGNNLYIYGGTVIQNGQPVTSKEYAVLDLSTSWDTSSPSWVRVVQANGPTAVADNLLIPASDGFITFGGRLQNGSPTDPNTVFQLRTSDNSWSQPDYPGPSRRGLSASVTEKNGVSWVFGGRTTFDPPVWQTLGDMYRFDGSKLEWRQVYPAHGSSLNPTGLVGHTASLIGNKMVILGGLLSSSSVLMNQLSGAWIFNTETNVWTAQPLGGNAPPPRWLHCAAVTLDDQIFLFGGGDGVNNLYGDFWLLNTTSWVWRQITPTGGVTPPTARSRHACERSGSSILILFGALDSNGINLDNSLYVYDPQSNQFTSRYTPNQLDTNYQPSGSSSLSIGAIVGIVVGCVVFGLAVICIAVFLIRRKRRQQKRESVISAMKPPIKNNNGVSAPGYTSSNPSPHAVRHVSLPATTSPPMVYYTTTMDTRFSLPPYSVGSNHHMAPIAASTTSSSVQAAGIKPDEIETEAKPNAYD